MPSAGNDGTVPEWGRAFRQVGRELAWRAGGWNAVQRTAGSRPAINPMTVV